MVITILQILITAPAIPIIRVQLPSSGEYLLAYNAVDVRIGVKLLKEIIYNNIPALWIMKYLRHIPVLAFQELEENNQFLRIVNHLRILLLLTLQAAAPLCLSTLVYIYVHIMRTIVSPLFFLYLCANNDLIILKHAIPRGALFL